MAGLAQLLLLGEHFKVGWQGTKPLRFRGLQRVDFRKRFGNEIIGNKVGADSRLQQESRAWPF